ncbi:MAG: Gfo/Idh/MocA family oxidoreductase [Candidatus Aenigmarchaeota archaeon]|nr:Gfo/Idh/MocA family oxidoreductase [Candidatus Aenigmarchaeota archaeon]
MLKAAVIGTGYMGKNHCRIYRDIYGIDLISVSDTNFEEAKKTSDKFSCKAYDNSAEMIKKENPDFVSICVPTILHKDIALEVINSGCHALIEKPIADSSENAMKIINSAKEKDVKLMIGHIERFNPVIKKIFQCIESGMIGKIWCINTVRKNPTPDRIRDVGVVIDLAVHDIDIMRYLLKSEPVRISAETGKYATKNEDIMNALLRFENGVLGILDVNWITPLKIREIYINGEKGMLKADYISQNLEFFGNSAYPSNDIDYSQTLMGISQGEIRKIPVDKREPLKVELEAFIDCIKNNKEPPVTGQDGLRALEIAETILKKSAE